jgi:hypothetical protein
MQTRLTPGELLDGAGRLVERGWATQEVRRYRRASVRAWPLRRKEWDYYCVLTPNFGVALTVADNDYIGFLGITWLDFARKSFTSEDLIVPLPRGRFAMPESADAGDVVQTHAKVSIAYRHVAGGRELTFAAPGFDRGRGLHGALFLAQPAMDRMVIATPFPRAPRHFYYNQKISCLPAAGHVTIGSERHAFAPNTAFGVLDWGRGAWTYDNLWYWGSASGAVAHKGTTASFGFNIGYGFGDTSAASENMLFLDGRAHKLDQVTFHLPPGAPDSAPWRFTSNDKRFEMTFAPIVDRAANFDYGLIKSNQHQVFGRFSGVAVTDDGTPVTVQNLIGFAEKVHNRW